jgi:hypothetical protein
VILADARNAPKGYLDPFRRAGTPKIFSYLSSDVQERAKQSQRWFPHVHHTRNSPEFPQVLLLGPIAKR